MGWSQEELGEEWEVNMTEVNCIHVANFQIIYFQNIVFLKNGAREIF